MKKFRIFIVMATLFISACASNPMVASPQQELQKPMGNQTQVIFMRSSFVGSAINASLYDVTNGDIKFIGVIANGTKLSYKTSPGKHIFMVISEAADFMEADLASEKNYFSIATPRMGVWAGRFSLWPIKNDPNADYHTEMADFKDWLENTELVENTEKSKSWYKKNKEKVKKKYEKYWPKWQNKTAEDILKRTLSPQDGM